MLRVVANFKKFIINTLESASKGASAFRVLAPIKLSV